MVCGDTEMQAVMCCSINSWDLRSRKEIKLVCVQIVCCLALAACKYWSYSLANASNIARAAEARSHQAAHVHHLFITATRALLVPVMADSLVLKYLHGLNHRSKDNAQLHWRKLKG